MPKKKECPQCIGKCDRENSKRCKKCGSFHCPNCEKYEN